MVFSVDGDQFHRLAENLQSVEQLYAFAYGDIGVGRAVQQEQGSVYLVGIEERALLGEQVGVSPGIAVGSRYRIV